MRREQKNSYFPPLEEQIPGMVVVGAIIALTLGLIWLLPYWA